MKEKFGIFLVNGINHNYGNRTAIGITKLHVGDFESPDDAMQYLKENPIVVQHIIMQYWMES